MSAATITATKIGRRLKPYTLGHQRLLEYFDSVFASGVDIQLLLQDKEGLKRLYADFLITAFACTHTLSDAVEKLSSRRAGLHVARWKVKLGKFDLGAEAFALSSFIQLSKQEPKYWILQDADGSQSSIPWSQYLLSKIKEVFGKSDFEAENTHFQDAVVDFCVHLESKGAIRLMNEDDERLIEAAKDPANIAKLEAKERSFKERYFNNGLS